MSLKTWFLETRPQFLILSLVLAFLGAAVAGYDGYFQLGRALLAALGLLLAHISVNTLNDYFDYRSGIDLATPRTPFSGGSGILPAARMQPRQVLWLGLGALLLAVPIGIYFVIVSGWLLLPLLLAAALFILLYSPAILKRRWPEWVAGAGLGSLPILGAYFVQTGAYSWHALVASIPSGILVHNLLLLNEFPDAAADSRAARKTLPITLGGDRASLVYSALMVALYLWLIGWVLAGVMPAFSLLGLLTLPFAIKAIRGSRHYRDMGRLVPAMASNVVVVLLTQLLMGTGYVLAGIL